MNVVPQVGQAEGRSHSQRSLAAFTPRGPAPSLDCEFDRRPNWWWARILGLSLLAVLLRFFAIDHNSLWLDEAITCQSIKVPTLDLVTGRVILDKGNPPLYWILGGAWDALFGDSEIGLRSLPALCGALTIPFLALVGRRLVGRRVGLWGAFLLAISPTAIELSNEARPYSLVGLLAVVATWFFVRWVETHRRLDLAFYSVAVFLTCSAHYYGAAVPLAHAASLATLPRERRRLESWLGAMIFAGLLSLPVMNILLIQLEMEGNLSRLGDRWVTQFLATPMVFGVGRNLGWRDSPGWLLGALTVLALAGFWLPAGVALSRCRRNPFGAVLLGSWSLIPIIVPLVVAVTLSPIYATRYAFVGLPPFLLLAGWGLERCRPAIRWALFGLILTLTCLSLYRYANRPLKDDWRTETRFVLERLKPGELIAFDPYHEIMTFSYYLERYGAAPPPMIDPDPGPSGEGRLPESISGVWLVRCAAKDGPERMSDYFARIGLRLVEHRRSGRIEIYHYAGGKR